MAGVRLKLNKIEFVVILCNTRITYFFDKAAIPKSAPRYQIPSAGHVVLNEQKVSCTYREKLVHVQKVSWTCRASPRTYRVSLHAQRWPLDVQTVSFVPWGAIDAKLGPISHIECE